MLRELGTAELQRGNTDEAAARLQSAVAKLPDPAERAHAAADLGLALQLSDRPEDAVAALGEAIDALPESERELGLLLQAIRAAASQGNLAAFALARRARSRFKADVEAPRTAGEHLFTGGIAYREATSGSAARAIELARRALPGLMRDPGPGTPAIYVAPLALFFAGALEEATEAFTLILDHAQRHGSQLGFANASHLRAGVWWRRGNAQGAEAETRTRASTRASWSAPGVARARRDPARSGRRRRRRRRLERRGHGRRAARRPRLRAHAQRARPPAGGGRQARGSARGSARVRAGGGPGA